MQEALFSCICSQGSAESATGVAGTLLMSTPTLLSPLAGLLTQSKGADQAHTSLGGLKLGNSLKVAHSDPPLKPSKVHVSHTANLNQ
jgi:hypothetical protein